MRAVLLALLLLAPTATPTLTRTPTPTASATATSTATALPSATATPSPSPSPIPQGPQQNGTYCTGLLGWCPDFAGMMAGVVNGLLSWLQSTLHGWVAVGPVGPAAPATTPHTTVTPPAAPASGPGLTGGANALVASVLDAVTTEADYTTSGYAPLHQVFGHAMDKAKGLFALAFVLLLFLSYWEGLRRGAAQAWKDFGLRLLVVMFYFQTVSAIVHLWAQLMGDIAASLSHDGMLHFVGTVLSLLAPGVDGSTGGIMQGTMDILLGIILVGVFVVMVVLLLYQRLVALALGALCYVILPFAIVGLFVPFARPQAAALIRTYVMFSLYAPLTALMIQVADAISFGVQSQDGFTTLLVRAVTGVVMLGALLAIPRIAQAITGGGHGLGVFGAPTIGGLIGVARAVL